MGLHDHWHTSNLYPQGNNPNAPWTGGWVGNRAALDALEER